jgi:type IV pilus assembly protein PilV
MLRGAVAMTDNRHGFTLVEFLVAIVILMVGMLGLLQSINIAMDKNLDNVFRTEAVMLADERMMGARVNPSASAYSKMTTVNVRGLFKNYSVTQSINQPTLKSKEVIIRVDWRKKNSSYSHSVSSLITTSD